MGLSSVRVLNGFRAVAAPGNKAAARAPKLSPNLASFLGEVDTTSRLKSVKKIWNLFKRQYPQSPTNRKEIVCDRQLKKIYEGRETLGFHEFSKLLDPGFEKK